MENKKYYYSIEGLRTIACIGIIMMHIKANNNYMINDFFYGRVVTSFSDFVFLFMMISSFVICCSYYKKVFDGTFSYEQFIKNRIKRVLPFFALLVFIDIIVNRNISSVIEGLADISLLFGLFPNNIEVIGVGWFVGLVFTFYIFFPFFCLLIKNKKRAWISLIISIILNIIVNCYFKVTRENIVYSLCYFVLGGIIYLYRDKLEVISSKYIIIILLLLICTYSFYLVFGGNTLLTLSISALLLVCGLNNNLVVLNNIFTRFISSLSFEIYLSHMMIFRAIELMKLNILFGNGYFQYFLTLIIVFLLTVTYSYIVSHLINKLLYKKSVISKY